MVYASDAVRPRTRNFHRNPWLISTKSTGTSGAESIFMTFIDLSSAITDSHQKSAPFQYFCHALSGQRHLVNVICGLDESIPVPVSLCLCAGTRVYHTGISKPLRLFYGSIHGWPCKVFCSQRRAHMCDLLPTFRLRTVPQFFSDQIVIFVMGRTLSAGGLFFC